MAEIRTYPYLTADPAHITVYTDWQYSNDVQAVELDELLQSWNPSGTLTAEIALRIDLKRVLQDCGFGMDAALRVVIGWRSMGTMLRGNGSRIDLNTSNTKPPVKLKVTVSGAEAAHDLVLFAALILISPGKHANTLAAVVPGSVLWLKENRLLLDSNGMFFPIEVIDFQSRNWNVPSDSAWYLDWDPSDLNQTVFGDIQLYLNSTHPQILSALSANAPISDIFQRFLSFDVARMLLLGALGNPNFVEAGAQFAEGTIGEVVHNLIREYFPNETPSSLSAKRSRSTFEALLQHHLGFLRG